MFLYGLAWLILSAASEASHSYFKQKCNIRMDLSKSLVEVDGANKTSRPYILYLEHRLDEPTIVCCEGTCNGYAEWPNR